MEHVVDLQTREHVLAQDRLPVPHDHLTQSLIVMRMKLRQAVPLVLDLKAAGLLNDLDQVLTQALNYTRSLVPVHAQGKGDEMEDQPNNTDPPTQSTMPPSNSELSVEDSVPHQKPRIRVLLVDDHSMVRQGLRSLLEGYSDIEVVGEAADGQESLDSVEHLRPSVVVMDLNMPNMNGVDATAAIKSRHPQTIVLGLSVNADHDNRAAMTRAGASALLTKEAAVDQLYYWIHQALAAKP